MTHLLTQIQFFIDIKSPFEIKYNASKKLTEIWVDSMVYCYNDKDGSFACKMHSITYEEKFNK